MTEVWEVPGLSAVEKLVLLSLADNANDAGVCWPSVQTIARRGSMTDRAVFKILARLEEQGYVSRATNPGRTSTYTVRARPLNDVHPCPTFIPPLNPVQETPEHGSPRTVIEPSENQKKDDAPKTPPLQANPKSERFTSFWDVWPKSKRKVDRAGCLRTWEARDLDKQADQIMRAVALAKHSKDWTKDGGDWIPMPITWLRQERWLAYENESDDMMAGAI
jgi:hypothetical protein